MEKLAVTLGIVPIEQREAGQIGLHVEVGGDVVNIASHGTAFLSQSLTTTRVRLLRVRRKRRWAI